MVSSKNSKPVRDGDGKSSIVIATLTALALQNTLDRESQKKHCKLCSEALAYLICKITKVHEKLD